MRGGVKTSPNIKNDPLSIFYFYIISLRGTLRDPVKENSKISLKIIKFQINSLFQSLYPLVDIVTWFGYAPFCFDYCLHSIQTQWQRHVVEETKIKQCGFLSLTESDYRIWKKRILRR